MDKKTVPNRIAILLYPGVEPMDYQGPCEIFDLWNLEAQGPEVVLVAETLEPITCAYGRKLIAQYDFSNCPSFEALLIPGGIGRHQAEKNEKLMEFLKFHGNNCRYLLSVCTGIFLLTAANLILDHQVTTHWEFIEKLSFYEQLRIQGERRFIQDRNVWTSAGIFSGIDMSLAFIHSFIHSMEHQKKMDLFGIMRLE